MTVGALTCPRPKNSFLLLLQVGGPIELHLFLTVTYKLRLIFLLE